jgi:phage-related protein (TIGR01555 family)
MQRENTTASEILSLASKGYSVQKDPPNINNKPVSRLDSWVDKTTQYGIDSKINNVYHALAGRIGREQLESLYQEDWVCRKGVDIPAEDMTRKGVKFQINEDDENDAERIEDIETILNKDYNWMTRAKEAISFARLSGGSATVFNYGGTEEDQRDPIEDQQKREIKWVQVVPAWNAEPVSWYTDFDHPKFLQPEHYLIHYRGASVGKTVTTHESRMIIMQGRQTTPDKKAIERGWSDSYIRAAYEAIRNFQTASSSSAETMQDFIFKTLGMKDLAQKVMMGETDLILERIYLAAKQLQINDVGVYDTDGEKLEKHGTPVTGLADLWDRFGDIICGAWSIPRSRFFSAETGNLGGDSSQADRDNYFDGIKSDQVIILKPYLNDFLDNVGRAEQFETSDIKYTFNSLREKTSSESIKERRDQAETDALYIDRQVVTPEEVAESRFSKSEPDLDTMNIDLDERDEQKELEGNNEDHNEQMLGMVNDAFENHQRLTLESQEKAKIEQQVKEEKTDAQPQIINVKPEINIEQPVINNNIPAQKELKLDGVENELKEIKDKIKEIDTDIEFELE